MMKHRVLTLIIIAVAIVQSVSSQEVTRLSLSDAQQYALGNNLTLANVNLDYQAAQKKIWETAAAGLPQISASGQWQYSITPVPTIDIMPGQTVSLGTRNGLTASASLDQLIFNGSYIVGLQAAKVYSQMAELGVRKGEIEINAAVSQSYYLALLTSESHNIVKTNLVLIGQTLEQMRRMNAEGFVDRTSVDKIEVTYNLIKAQEQSLERQVKNTRDMLKYIIGMPMTTRVELTEDLSSIVDALPRGYLTIDTYDQDEHIDIKLAQTEVVISDMLRRLTASEWLPSVGAKVMFQHNFVMPEFSFQRASSAYLGVGLNVPIFKSGATRAKYNQAKIALKQAENKETLARQNLDLQFQQTLDEFRLSWDNFYLQRQNVSLASRVLEDTKKSLAQGVSTSTDLIQSNNAYLEAVTTLVQSEMNLLNSKIKLDKILSK